MEAALEPHSEDDSPDDIGLTEQQIAALEKLDALGAEPAPKGEDGKSIYDSNAQIRALQLVAEGRLGGPGRGQGRKAKPRVGAQVAAEMNKRVGKIVSAIDRGLDSDSDRTALQAADMAIKIERDEAALQMKEAEQDIDNLTKEELVGTLIQLVSDPGTTAQLEAVIDIPEEDIQEVTSDDIEDAASEGRAKAAARSKEDRPNGRSPRRNGRGSGSRNSAKGSNPFTSLAGGRAAD